MLGIKGTPSDCCKRFFLVCQILSSLCSYLSGIGRRRPVSAEQSDFCEARSYTGRCKSRGQSATWAILCHIIMIRVFMAKTELDILRKGYITIKNGGMYDGIALRHWHEG